jgi:hypothetical protein
MLEINFNSIDLKQFNIKEGIFCDENAILITPDLAGVDWTQDNKIFRSSIWSKNGKLLSASFPKFTNFGENPQNFPVPELNKHNYQIINKIDGSTAIIDFYNNQLNIRTRGTFDYTGQKNASDFEYALNKYPKIINFLKNNQNITLLFEIVTPNNIIVINYGEEIDLYLIGAINKENYLLYSQAELDQIAAENSFKRPQYFDFKGDEIFNKVNELKNIEGFCLYKGQGIWKIKNSHYLTLHRMKSELSSFDKTVDVYFSTCINYNYNEFYNFIHNTFDYEIAEQCKGFISKICDTMKEVDKIVLGMKNFINNIKNYSSRKEQAKGIIASYGNTNRASFVFTLLDGKELTSDQLKKLFWQKIK